LRRRVEGCKIVGCYRYLTGDGTTEGGEPR
jgi:hypothetical protein